MGVDCLVDTNVIIRSLVLHDPLAPVAQQAVRLLRQREARLFVAAQNLVEFWAVATRPASVNGLGLTVQQASDELDQVQSLFSVLHETAESYPIWRDIVTRVGVSGRQAHDARLTAVMLTNGVTRILTFNRQDFLRYPELTVIDPVAVAAASDK